MRWLPFRKSAKKTTPAPVRRPYTFSLQAPAEITGLPGATGVAPRIPRREALQVPAVLRARNLICGSLGTLPIRVHGADRRVVTDVTYLVPQPDPDIPNSVVMSQTVEDLLFEGVAWWKVTRWGWHGYPVEARHVPVDSVTIRTAGGATPSEMLISPDQMVPVDGQVLIDGVPVGDHEMIRFDSPNPPLLVHAARAIRTCLLLDQAAALYAKDPLPLGYFAPKDGEVDPADDDDIEEMLDDWEAARARRAWGYVPAALDAKPLQWNPEQLQLADQRQHAVLEIARAAGVDPEDLGVSVTSRTYANQEQRWQAQINTNLGPYVSAIQDRLSMRDVLPRGYTAQVDFGGFLRGDALTRMQTYEVGKRVGAYTDERIAELENIPTPTPAQRPPQLPPPPQPGQQQEAAQQPQEADMSSEPAYVNRYVFDASDTEARIMFGGPEVAASFRVDQEKRTISGLAVPWGKVARNGFAKWKFPEGSLQWSSDSRVKLNLDHDRGQTLGRAVRLQQTSAGLDVTFKVARGAEGDRALALAEDGVYDGLSIEIDFDGEGDDWQPDPADESVRMARQASLRAVALTPMPAFDDARVTRVAASRDGVTVTSPTTADVAASAAGTAPAQQFTMTDDQITALAAKQGEAMTAAITAAFERLPLPQHSTDAQRPVPAGRVQVVSEPPVYSFAGRGPSLVRDAWHARVEGNDDARERLRKFGRQQQEILSMFARRPDLAFAAETTAANSAIIPPGYRPDLYVSQLLQGRPLVDAVSRGALTDATPFTIPKFTSATGAAANHVEGTNPSDGDLAFGSATVSPGGVSGKFTLTREIVDSSNPAIDAIAFGAMREAYAQNTEAKVYTELNGANGQGGTITAGFVPSGAQAAVTASLAAGVDSGKLLITGMRGALALYPFRRFGAPNRMHLSQEATSALASATGSDGRPLLPSVGATNAYGVGNAVTQGWFLDGLAAVPTWSMSGNAAGDADVLIFNSADVWAWESPLLTFRFEEKSGPANIELALFGYFATRLIRPVGLSAIRHTVTP